MSILDCYTDFTEKKTLSQNEQYFATQYGYVYDSRDILPVLPILWDR